MNATMIRLLVVSIAILTTAAWSAPARAAAPVLDPIANMTVGAGGCAPSTADQAISATDAEGDAITFTSSGPAWMTVTSDAQVGNTRTGNIHLAAPSPGTAGSFPASVTATAVGESDTKSFTISVITVNQPPFLNQPANMIMNEGTTANQTLTGSDPCGAPLTFSKVSGPTFLTVTTTSATTGNINLAPSLADEGTYTATLRASNGTLSNDKSFAITVNHVHSAPVLAQPANMIVNEGATANQVITATDPDGDPVTFSKVAGPAFMTVTTATPGAGTATGNINLAPGFLDSGSYSATVRATDTFPMSNDKTFTITVNDVNRAPALAQPANMTVTEGSTANQTLAATDPDGNSITFSKVSGPTYVTVTTTSPGFGTATGNVNVAPGFLDAGTAAVAVRVTDNGSPPLSNDKSFTVTVNCLNRSLVLAQPANMTVNEGATANQPLTATDPDGDPITFSKVSGPTYVTVTTTSPGTGTGAGNVNLAPGFSDAGTATVTVAASSNGCGITSDRKSFAVTVNEAQNRAPVLAQPANMAVQDGCTADQTITASDPDGDPLTFSKVAGPPFMSVSTTSPTTGNIHLAPGFGDQGTHSSTVRANDGVLSDSKSLSITVNASNLLPNLNTVANMTVDEGATADQVITGSDPGCGGGTLTFAKVAGPVFMTVTTTTPGPGTATGNIHLAPGFTQSGTYSATVRATDSSGGSVDRSFTIVVNDVPPGPNLVQPVNMVVVPGSTADQTITATDPDGNTLTFAMVAGPTFMTVTTTTPGTGTGTGNIHLAPSIGTPVGTYSASVSASDGTASDTKSFTITVCPSGPPPTLAQPRNMTVNEGATANQPLSATDPDGNPLTFSKAAGPTFMTVTTTSPGTGTATGNVHLAPGFSDAGVFQATVAVSDDPVCGTDSKSFTITVNEGGLVFDDFNDNTIDPSRWTINQTGTGTTVTETNQRLEFAHSANSSDDATGGFGIFYFSFARLTGDYDIQVDFHLLDWPSANGVRTALVTSTVSTEGANEGSTQRNSFGTPADFPGAPREVYGTDFHNGVYNLVSTTDLSGKLRQVRSGNVLTGYYWSGSSWVVLGSAPVTARDVSFGVASWSHDYAFTDQFVRVAFDDFIVNQGQFVNPGPVARAFTTGGNKTIRLGSSKPFWSAQVEPIGGSFAITDVDPATLVLISPGTGSVSQISAVSDRTVLIADLDNNDIADMRARFRKQDLRMLFSNVTGTSTLTVSLGGDVITGGSFRAAVDVEVVGMDGALAATVAPNPFNPSGTLTFTTTRPGRAKVELFDANGRLVRTILDERSLGVGVHEVTIDGRGPRGGALASGIYFLRGVSAEGAFTKTIAILK